VIAREHLDLLVAGLTETTDQLIIQLVAHLDGAIGFGLQFFGNLFAADEHELFSDNGTGDFAQILTVLADSLDVQFTDTEEEAVDVFIAAVAQRAQQRSGRELLLLVDVHEDHVVDIHRELHPRSAERNDARRDQALPVRVRVLLEHHAR
jgi:hypothetical protein